MKTLGRLVTAVAVLLACSYGFTHPGLLGFLLCLPAGFFVNVGIDKVFG